MEHHFEVWNRESRQQARRYGSRLALMLMPIWGASAWAQSAAGGGDSLQEVVVTATRQAESISKVAVSVTAITPEVMEQKGMKSFADIARFTPGVDFDSGNGGGNRNTISIRGISSGAGSGTTGIYLDDTPIQMRALGFSADDSLPGIFDLERVEVLRGPQGTLFGAGSEGGTVRYITAQPSLTKYSGVVRGEVSGTRYGDLSYETGAAFGGPIVNDVLGFRVSAWHRHDGGYVDRVDTSTGNTTEHNANHGQIDSLRGALTFQPVSGLMITPSILYQKRNVHDTDLYFVGISDPGSGVFLNGSPDLRGSLDRFSLPALLIRYDWTAVSLISNTSYFKRDNTTGYDGTLYDLSYYQSLLSEGCDGCAVDQYPLLTPKGVNPAVGYYRSPSLVTNNQRNFTEELRLQSNDPAQPLTWVAGVFFQRSRQHSAEELVDPMGDRLFNQLFGQGIEDYFGWPLYSTGGHIDSYINNTNAVDKQTAVFADLTYKLTQQLKLTLGGRYAWTKYSFSNFADGSQNGVRTEGQGETSEKPFTPKAGLSYQMNEENLFYTTWAKGFRAGGANAPVPYDACKTDLQQLGLSKSPDSYKSDRVKSWEIGAKNSLFNHKLQLASSAYYINWDGIQDTVFLNSCAIQFTGNLGKATSRGFDVQAEFRPISGLSFETAIGYTNAYYTEDLRLGGPDAAPVRKAGDGLDIAPWTLAFGIEKSLPLFEDRAYIRIDDEYKSRVTRPSNSRNPADQAYDGALVAPPATNFLSLRAGVAFDSFNVSLFVDNVLNSRPQVTYTHEDRDTVLFQASTFRPLTIGITGTFNWR
ncbi:MAG: TonB-dependent receptor [Proteobacteria bacterium]|nr:TonB-dependent receptor [Pseudomonadota bacterium]